MQKNKLGGVLSILLKDGMPGAKDGVGSPKDNFQIRPNFDFLVEAFFDGFVYIFLGGFLEGT